jgi:predicted SAM-dependent methyltransferase
VSQEQHTPIGPDVLGRFELREILSDSPPFSADLVRGLRLRGLQVGCGKNLKPGWLNTDHVHFRDLQENFTAEGRISRWDDDIYYLEHDATTAFPLDDACFDWAYAEHFIEHLPQRKVVEWLKEMRRLLRPGGHIRVTTPSLRRYVEGYLDPDQKFFAEHFERFPRFKLETSVPRPAWMVNQIFYKWGHRWIYDLDEVRHTAGLAGFAPEAVVECAFSEGREPEVASLDKKNRDDETLYVEIAR